MEHFEFLIQLIVGGIMMGSVYALIAAGFSLSIGVLRLFNITHGHFYLLGGFLTYQFVTSGLGYYPGVILAVISVALIGCAVHFIAVKPLKSQQGVAPLLTTLAVAFLIEGLALAVWGGRAKTVDSPISDNIVRIGFLGFNQQTILAFCVAIFLTVMLYLFLKRTKLGKALRATAENETMATLVGIKPDHTRLAALGISAGLAGAAGAIIAPLFPIAVTTVGWYALFKAFIVVMLGGMGNVMGAIAGGIFLGVLESVVGGELSATWVNTIGFGVVIVVLILKPQGLFGHAETKL